MVKKQEPEKGDFLMWDSGIYIIIEIKEKTVRLTNGEEVLKQSLVPTTIKVWEIE